MKYQTFYCHLNEITPLKLHVNLNTLLMFIVILLHKPKQETPRHSLSNTSSNVFVKGPDVLNILSGSVKTLVLYETIFTGTKTGYSVCRMHRAYRIKFCTFFLVLKYVRLVFP